MPEDITNNEDFNAALGDEAANEAEANTDIPLDGGQSEDQPDAAKGESPAGEETEAKGDDAKDEEGDEKPDDAENVSAQIDKLELPEDFAINEEQGKALGEIFEKHSITQEAAQDLIEMKIQSDRDAIATSDDASLAAHDEQVTAWQDEIKNDADLGGDNYEKSLANSDKGLELYGGSDVKDLAVKYGLEHHPAFIRFGESLYAKHDGSAFSFGNSSTEEGGMGKSFFKALN